MFIAHRGSFPSTTARESDSLCIRSPQLCLKYFTEDPQPPPTNLTDVRKKKRLSAAQKDRSKAIGQNE